MAKFVLGFGRSRRILRNEEFRKLYKTGKRLNLPVLTMIYKINDSGLDPKPPRLGLSVSRKVGKANQRNIIKRHLREIFRLNQLKMDKSSEIVLIPRKEVLELDYFELETMVLKLFMRAKLINE